MRIAKLLGHKSKDYYKKVLSTSGLLAYWPLWEASGTTVTDIANARNGTYTGVDLGSTGIGDGRSCPLFGAADMAAVYSAGLAGAFSGATGSLMAWVKVSAVGVWTDGEYHYIFNFAADGNNEIWMRKSNTNNRVLHRYASQNTGAQVQEDGLSTTGWACYIYTWTRAGAGFSVYKDGIQVGTSQAITKDWQGTLGATFCTIGAEDTTPGYSWSGNVAHVALWNAVLPIGEIKRLSVV